MRWFMICSLLVWNGGCATRPVDLELLEEPASAAETAARALLSELGLVDVEPFMIEYYPGRYRPEGVVVGHVEAGSAAARAGLESGDVIHAVGGEPTWAGTNDPAEIIIRFEQLLGGAVPATLVVYRYHTAAPEKTEDGELVWSPPVRNEPRLRLEQ